MREEQEQGREEDKRDVLMEIFFLQFLNYLHLHLLYVRHLYSKNICWYICSFFIPYYSFQCKFKGGML